MATAFKDVKEGQLFRISGSLATDTGQESLLQNGDHVLIKIPFMRNFYNTTGNKRNAKLRYSTSKMNEKYFYIDDQQTVEVIS